MVSARTKPSDAERLAALQEIQQTLGDLKCPKRILVDLMLSVSYDALEFVHSDEFPDHLKSNVMVQQQRALALNRRNGPGDRDEAQLILEKLVKENGVDPETLGLLGRVHKDRYKELKKKKKSCWRSGAMPNCLGESKAGKPVYFRG